jgi:NAD(P) transhydrogenase subunit beta
MDINLLINFAYIISALFFIIGLKMLTSLTRARQGNIISGIGMFIAIVVTLLDRGIVDYKWILIGIVVGTVIGTVVPPLAFLSFQPIVLQLYL